ncbi:MAG: hypothetical protein F6K28_55730 [Microcoleus sp. SIO2G3]|nr:hypothetical protein [Microcoleus sp. SIO2G3]
MPNRISAQLSPADYAEIMAALDTVREKLPFLVGLSVSDRRTLAKLGDKSRAFVQRSAEFAQQNPDYLPRLFDLDEMRRDVELFEVLSSILMSLTQLQELVKDTSMLVGSEAYAAARVVYRSAKANGEGAGFDSLLEELGQRFNAKPTKAQLEANPKS